MDHGLRTDRRKPKVSRLPKLSLGLSSVKFIVNKFQEDYKNEDNESNGAELVKYDPNIDIDEAYHDFAFNSSKGQVLKRFLVNLAIALSRCIPSVSYGNFGVIVVLISASAPKMLSYLVLYPLCRLVFGTLYPAYASYKAVRTKNLKEYVKWMMYWIVFALFSCTETFTDMFLSWFPFYYEVKIVLVLWLLSPATKGSSILYRKFVHPALCRREQEIDEYIAKAKDQGYHTVLNLGTKGVNYATTVIMQTAIKGGGGLVQQIKKSYSLSDLSECDPQDERSQDEADDVIAEPRLIRRNTVRSGYNTRRSASESNNRAPMYFPEVDVDVRPARTARSDQPDLSHIKSSEDISSGYSSADNSVSQLSRTSSVGARTRPRPRSTVTPIKRPQAAEDDDVIIEELQEDDIVEYSNMPPLLNVSTPLFLSNTNPPFLYQCIGDQMKVVQVLGNLQINPQIDEANNSEPKQIIKNNDLVSEQIKNNEIVSHVDSDLILVKPLDDVKLLGTSIDNDIPIQKETKINDDNDSGKEIKQDENKPIIENDNQVANKISADNNDNIILENNNQNKATKILPEISENIDVTDGTSLDTMSLSENYSAESDDEASFGTPDDSPRTKRRKSPRVCKHGKGRAPLPPTVVDDINLKSHVSEIINKKENIKEFLDTSRDLAWSTSKPCSYIVNPIAENKKRHKTKSPARIKRNSTTISKLLQIPGKIAFWNKNDDKSKSEVSNSSDDHSRRSSTVEQVVDEFQSCSDLNLLVEPNKITGEKMREAETSDVMESIIDARELESEMISRIQDKSDELQKLIEAKLESHPEYKIVSLHAEEIPSSSKSTDV